MEFHCCTQNFGWPILRHWKDGRWQEGRSKPAKTSQFEGRAQRLSAHTETISRQFLVGATALVFPVGVDSLATKSSVGLSDPTRVSPQRPLLHILGARLPELGRRGGGACELARALAAEFAACGEAPGRFGGVAGGARSASGLYRWVDARCCLGSSCGCECANSGLGQDVSCRRER